ncbi:MAG: transcriptional regulator [Thermomonas sp.]
MFEFVESSVFARYVYDYLTDDEYAALQWYLSEHPEAGDLIPGSAGCRKLRWGTEQAGKRGGVRVIYYGQTAAGLIWLLAIYAKTKRDNLSAHVIRMLKEQLVKP